MGKFDGLLICSDIDGTYVGKDTIAENNEVVKYFIENGGKFTFSTGRPAGYVKRSEFFHVINAPVCLYNGGIVYDYENEKILFEERLDIKVDDFIKTMSEKNDAVIEFYIFDNCEEDYIFFPDLSSVTKDAGLLQPIKVICVCKDTQSADDFKAFAEKQEIFKNSCISKSDNVTVEFNSIKASKGIAIEFIKEYLGDIKTSIGVGDNGNDIPLIKHADIGVAVENAPEEVKKIADVIVKPCNEYAIKDLIGRLEAR